MPTPGEQSLSKEGTGGHARDPPENVERSSEEPCKATVFRDWKEVEGFTRDWGSSMVVSKE